MKRVSSSVAKALKEAGYPQNLTNSHYTYYGELVCYGIAGETGYDAPYVMEAWLWLWREKGIYINIERVFTTEGVRVSCSVSYGINLYRLQYRLDPEQAIIAGIEYLVTNDLIK